MSRITELDGWRALAVTSVLIAHFFGFPSINLGRLGVELFFVLSGRLMAEILFYHNVSIRSFYVGRFTRVYPALFVFASVTGIAGLLVSALHTTLPIYISVLSMTLNYTQTWVGHGGVFGHIWSLCVEVHCYLVLGGVAFLVRRGIIKPAVACIGLAVICMINGVISTRMGLDYYDTYWRSDVRGASIFMGAFAYMIVRESKNGELLPWAIAMLFVSGVLLNFDAVPDTIKYTAGTTLIAFSLVNLSNAPDAVLCVIRLPFITFFGLMSYSVYLWQQPFWRYTEHMITRAIALLIALIFGYLSYRFIEGPSRRFLNRKFGHKPDSVART